jgi:hypothetical protein
MSEIHYFPRYSQPENFTTNNTLLLLLRLNQYNRLKFQRFMEKLCADQELQLSSSWLHFRQQRVTPKSVLDGFISQDSIKIAVETKLTDAFDLVQLENPLTVFGAEQHKLLILLSPTPGAISDTILESIRVHAREQNIQVLHTSFEDIVGKARSCLSEHDEEMLALVDDYESFCSEWKLLPRDRYTMFVPPCRESFQDNLEFSLYYCPVTYSRKKVEYLGIYANKAVRAIGRIVKIAACNVDLAGNTVTVEDESVALTTGEAQRVLGASRRAETHDWDVSRGHKFYLCDELVETDFRKTSSGGIMGHRYFDLEEVLGTKIPNSIAELASLLRGRAWPESQS